MVCTGVTRRFWGDDEENVDGRRENRWTQVLAAGLVCEEQQGREEDEDVGGDVEGARRAADVARERPRLDEREEHDDGPEAQNVCGVGRRHGWDAPALYTGAGEIRLVGRGRV